MKSLIIIIVLSAFVLPSYCQPFYHRYSGNTTGDRISEMPDGDILLAGSGLMKVNNQGNFLWGMNYQGLTNNCYAIGVLPAAKKGAYLLITSDNTSAPGYYILRTDSTGNPVWAKYYNYNSTIAKGMIHSYDGNLIITATDDSCYMLIKTDTLGQVLWAKHYNSPGAMKKQITEPLELADSSIIFAGGINTVVNVIDTNDFPYSFNISVGTPMIVKTDLSGNLIWSKAFYFDTLAIVFSNHLQLSASTIFASKTNKLYICFSRYIPGSYGGASFGLARLDNTGDIEFVNGGGQPGPYQFISENSDSSLNILFPGGSTSELYYYETAQYWRMDRDLNPLYSYVYKPYLGNHSWYPIPKFGFGDVIELKGKGFAYSGKIVDMPFELQGGASLLVTDSTGYEGCVAHPDSVYIFPPDFNYKSAVLVLQEDSGIQSTTLNVTAVPFIPGNCNCDSMPVAGFNWSVTGQSVQFTDTSSMATTIRWYFGDGSSSLATNPYHTYSDTGIYHVRQTVYNDCGIDEIVTNITISDTMSNIQPAKENSDMIFVFPNPTSGQIYISGKLTGFEQITITNSLGVIFYNNKINNEIDVSELAPGYYLLILESRDRPRIVKSFIKK